MGSASAMFADTDADADVVAVTGFCSCGLSGL